MGMFDYVKCEVPLPDKYEGQLQTKDFDCRMDLYILDVQGRLLKQSALEKGDMNFHGILNAYGYDSSTGAWHEYNIKFTDGNLVEITQVVSNDSTPPKV